MPKESKASLKPKKGESFLKLASQISAKIKIEDVHEGIQTFLRVAYLKRKGILKEDFWPFELDTPTTVVSILADYLVLYYEILNNTNLPKTDLDDNKLSDFDILTKINKNFEGIKPDSNFFIRVGKNWIISYKGESITLPDLERIRYVIHLLDNPDIEIHSFDLINAVKKKYIREEVAEQFDAMKSSKNEAEHRKEWEEWEELSIKDKKEELHKKGVSLTNLRIDELTKDQLDILEDKVYDIYEELKDAKGKNNQQAIDRKEKELERSKRHLLNEYGVKTNISPKGIKFYQLHRPGPEAEKARKNVTNQIRKAIKDIKKEIPFFAQYLNNHIETGINCVYKPDDSNPITWHINF